MPLYCPNVLNLSREEMSQCIWATPRLFHCISLIINQLSIMSHENKPFAAFPIEKRTRFLRRNRGRLGMCLGTKYHLQELPLYGVGMTIRNQLSLRRLLSKFKK